MNNRITEGYMPFMGYQTYYRIVGEPSEKAPLLLLHGGPGSTHNYFEVLDCIAEASHLIRPDRLRQFLSRRASRTVDIEDMD